MRLICTMEEGGGGRKPPDAQPCEQVSHTESVATVGKFAEEATGRVLR